MRVFSISMIRLKRRKIMYVKKYFERIYMFIASYIKNFNDINV